VIRFEVSDSLGDVYQGKLGKPDLEGGGLGMHVIPLMYMETASTVKYKSGVELGAPIIFATCSPRHACLFKIRLVCIFKTRLVNLTTAILCCTYRLQPFVIN